MRICLIGVGFHGRRIGELISQLGGEVVAAVDAGPQVGQPLSESVVIEDDVDRALDRAGAVDVAIVAIPGDLAVQERVAGPCLDRGVDVLTLSADAFDPPASWAARIDERARAGGASFAATGVQDVWWVHLPAVAAASVSSLTRIEIEHVVSLADLPAPLAELMQLGRPVEQFDAVSAALGNGPAILGDALAVLARRLGLEPTESRRTFAPVVAEQALSHPAGTSVAPGALAGVRERAELDTDGGVVLCGDLVTRLLSDGACPRDTLQLHGDPSLRLEHAPFPGTRVTDVAAVARIPDIVAAPPGFHDAATMPPPRTVTSLGRRSV